MSSIELAALLTLALVAGAALGVWRSSAREARTYRAQLMREMDRRDRVALNHDRQLALAYDHAMKHLVQLVQDQGREREMLLNRIQEPIAAVGASLAVQSTPTTANEIGGLENIAATFGFEYDETAVGADQEPTADVAAAEQAVREARAATIDSLLAERGVEAPE